MDKGEFALRAKQAFPYDIARQEIKFILIALPMDGSLLGKLTRVKVYIAWLSGWAVTNNIL